MLIINWDKHANVCACVKWCLTDVDEPSVAQKVPAVVAPEHENFVFTDGLAGGACPSNRLLAT